MSRRACFVLLLAVAAACAGGDAPKPPEPAPAAPVDAAVPVVELQPSGVFDPLSGRHLDEDMPPIPTRPPERPSRAQRPIDLTLRSLPPGAIAAVDGVPLGPTPTYWAGDANGRVHEFTFVSPHYSVARYRFVPITSGILFARLEPVAGEEPPSDAGVPPIPLAAPSLAPPPPVPTVITPPRPRPIPSTPHRASTPPIPRSMPPPSPTTPACHRPRSARASSYRGFIAPSGVAVSTRTGASRGPEAGTPPSIASMSSGELESASPSTTIGWRSASPNVSG